MAAGDRRHCILIAGEDEEVNVSFGRLMGNLEHLDMMSVEVTPEILDRITSGEIDTVVFCPSHPKTKKGAIDQKKVKDLGAPVVFVPEKKKIEQILKERSANGEN